MRKLSYKKAGVDLHRGDAVSEAAVRMLSRMKDPRVIPNPGGFAGLFRPLRRDGRPYRDPVLVACNDGVGTKVLLAKEMNRWDTIGMDAVAMCVNDLVVQGADPLFFLDYIAAARLHPPTMRTVLRGIVAGCRQARTTLLGGETAEMPGMYEPGKIEVVGCAVGIVERSEILTGKAVRPGDSIIGIASSGIHSNGYSLVRRICMNRPGFSLRGRPKGFRRPLGATLLTPTRIYVRAVRALLDDLGANRRLKALAHITGSGIPGNLPRVLPEKCQARIDRTSWPVPPVFSFLQKRGEISTKEMFDTFNMGIGMIAVVDPAASKRTLTLLRRSGERAYPIGQIISGRPSVRFYRIAPARRSIYSLGRSK
jgi:phosphoribosylformylglycinamidine cyclo-ligase